MKTQESIPNLKKFVINFYSWRHWSKDHVKNQTKDVQDLVKKQKVNFRIQMGYVNGNKKTTNKYPDSHFRGGSRTAAASKIHFRSSPPEFCSWKTDPNNTPGKSFTGNLQESIYTEVWF